MSEEQVTTEELRSNRYDIDALFEDAFAAQKESPYVNAILWGPESVGKTYTALTFPGPIHYLDLDGGLDDNLVYFKDKDGNPTKEIKRIRVISLEDDKDNLEDPEKYNGFKVDPLNTLRNFDIALTALQQKKGGTVIVDTISQYNEWLKMLFESRIPKDVKDGKEYRNQFDWKYVNQKWLWAWEKLKNIEANLVVVAKAKNVYQGRDITDQLEPDLRPNTGYQTSIRAEMIREYDETNKVYKRLAKFNKFRGNKLAHDYVEQDLTYDRLLEILKEEHVK